jgi:hypothetical protein
MRLRRYGMSLCSKVSTASEERKSAVRDMKTPQSEPLRWRGVPLSHTMSGQLEVSSGIERLSRDSSSSHRRRCSSTRPSEPKSESKYLRRGGGWWRHRSGAKWCTGREMKGCALEALTLEVDDGEGPVERRAVDGHDHEVLGENVCLARPPHHILVHVAASEDKKEAWGEEREGGCENGA